MPVIGLAVKAASFLIYAFALAIGMAAWASFLLRRVRDTFSGNESELWVLVEPFRNIRKTSMWERPIAVLEIVLFCSFHLIALLTPLIICYSMKTAGRIEDPLLMGGAILVASLFSISMLTNYVVILHAAVRSGVAKPGSSPIEKGQKIEEALVD